MTFSEVVELIRVEAGVELEAVGFFEGGEVGAADVRGGDGVRYVLKWWEDDGAAGRRAAVLVERLRRRGYPIPRFVLADQFGDVTVMLQEFVGGETSDSVTDAVVERLLALNALQSGAADTNGASWTSYVADSLVNGCNGYCLHQPLRDYDGRTRSLLRSVAATGRALSELPSGDVVHLDFHHRNVLVSDKRLARGDRLGRLPDRRRRFRPGDTDVRSLGRTGVRASTRESGAKSAAEPT